MTPKSFPAFATVLIPLACEGSIAIRIDYDSGNIVQNWEVNRDIVLHLIGIAAGSAYSMLDRLNDEIEMTMMRDGVSPDINSCTRYATDKKIMISSSFVKAEITVLIPRLNVPIEPIFLLAENVLEDLSGSQWSTLDPVGFQLAYERAEAAYSMAEMGEDEEAPATVLAEDSDDGEEPDISVPLHQQFPPAVDGYNDQSAN